MKISEILLQDFHPEMTNTRITLERIPEDKPTFKPHSKSMAFGRLAAHVSTLPNFAITILTTPELDLASHTFPPLVMESRAKLLDDFETCSSKLQSLLAAATDQQLQQYWKLSWGEKIIAEGPRSLLYRTMFLNHLVHHRSQLGVYLRLNDLPIPGLYGPSADEAF
jgi:uncharacterized damage-inducible protein DinB